MQAIRKRASPSRFITRRFGFRTRTQPSTRSSTRCSTPASGPPSKPACADGAHPSTIRGPSTASRPLHSKTRPFATFDRPATRHPDSTAECRFAGLSSAHQSQQSALLQYSPIPLFGSTGQWPLYNHVKKVIYKVANGNSLLLISSSVN